MERREFTIKSLGALVGLSGLVAKIQKVFALGGEGNPGSTSAVPVTPGDGAIQKLFPTGLRSQEWQQFPAAGFDKPACGVVYRRKENPQNGMPLGGLDTGRLELQLDGRFGYCTIYNSICPQRGPLNLPFMGLTVGNQTWLLSRQRGTTGEFMFNAVQTPREIHYWGHYPVADLEFDMPRSPLSVGLRTWAPFLPGNSGYSNTPGAVFEVHLRNVSSLPQHGRLVFQFPGPTQEEAQISVHSPREKIPFSPYGHTWVPTARKRVRANRESVRGDFSGLLVTSEVNEIGYALGVIGNQEVRTGGGLDLPDSPYGTGQRWAKIGSELPPAAEEDFSGSISVDYELEPKERKTVRFVLAWYAPMWIGEADHTFLHMYATRYKSALDVAQFLSRKHASLLRGILGWQEVVYCEERLPVWLRESLVNILHLFSVNSLWATARPPIGPWCRPEDGLFGLLDGIVEDPAIEPIPDTFYANAPLVFFFPDLALSTLRGYKAYQFANGAAVWTWGGVVSGGKGGYKATAGTEFACPNPGGQTTTNGPCYVDMVDRYWQRTGNDEVLREFYASVKTNTIYTMSLRSEDGPDGIISVPSGNVDPSGQGSPGTGLEWFEWVRWYGMTPHVGGIHLANLKMVQRMAEKVGDHDFERQCREWFEQGSQSMENKLWAGEYYLMYNEPKTGKKSDYVFAYQLDGQWMAKFHGLSGVFRPERVKTVLNTIKRTCMALAPNGVANVATHDGKLPEGIGYGAIAYFTPELFMLAMSYMYAGEGKTGLEVAQRGLYALTIKDCLTWNQPNMLDGATGEMLFGSHYVQNMMLWALPAAMEGKDIAGLCAAGGLVDRLLQAAKKT